MKIEHVAIWVKNLETMKSFYQTYFGATANDKYTNEKKDFTSYFLSFESGARLELMHNDAIPESSNDISAQFTGLIHLAFSLGGKEPVDVLTKRLQAAGYELLDGPRMTGDGYYESTFLDPEGNRLELTE